MQNQINLLLDLIFLVLLHLTSKTIQLNKLSAKLPHRISMCGLNILSPSLFLYLLLYFVGLILILMRFHVNAHEKSDLFDCKFFVDRIENQQQTH